MSKSRRCIGKLYRQRLEHAPNSLVERIGAEGELKCLGNWGVVAVAGETPGFGICWVPTKAMLPFVFEIESAALDVAWTLDNYAVTGSDEWKSMAAVLNVVLSRAGGMLVGKRESVPIYEMIHIRLCAKQRMHDGTDKILAVHGGKLFEIVASVDQSHKSRE